MLKVISYIFSTVLKKTCVNIMCKMTICKYFIFKRRRLQNPFTGTRSIASPRNFRGWWWCGGVGSLYWFSNRYLFGPSDGPMCLLLARLLAVEHNCLAKS